MHRLEVGLEGRKQPLQKPSGIRRKADVSETKNPDEEAKDETLRKEREDEIEKLDNSCSLY